MEEISHGKKVPFGLDGTLTTGIISGLGRMLPAGAQTLTGARFSIPDVIQTDTAINPGNSGGPLMNLKGEVIGVNTAIESPIRGFAGIGYAVPASTVERVVPQLIAEGEVKYPWLGISGNTLSTLIAAEMGLDANQRGVLVVSVADESPAAKSGLQGSEIRELDDGLQIPVGGDIIVAINGQPTPEFDDLLAYVVRHTQVGDTVTLTIVRDGVEQDATLTLEARPDPEAFENRLAPEVPDPLPEE